jgi:hypothetical protein
MNINYEDGWDDVEGADAWLKELKKLLDKADRAAQNEDFAKRYEIAGYLNGFISKSRPQDAQVTDMDSLAAKAARDLMYQTIDERIAGMTQRTSEYLALAKAVASATEAAEAAAEGIRLTGVQNFISSATDLITSAKELCKSLDDTKADDKKIAKLIDTVVSSVENLRSGAAGLI